MNKETIYVFYLKKTKEVYAFTLSKELKDNFLSQRNPNCFIAKKQKMYTPVMQAFMQTHKDCMLGDFPYESDSGVSNITATYKEEFLLTQEVDEMEKDVEKIEKIFRKYPLKEKYQKSIERLIQIDDGDGNLTINTLSLFVDLHRNTFIEEEEPENELSSWKSQSVNEDDFMLNNF